MVYENIVRLCAEHKISVAKLEKACGLGNGTVRGWETSSPRVISLKAVADYFGCSVDDLITATKS